GEADEGRVFSDCAGRKVLEIKFASLGRRHARKFNHKDRDKVSTIRVSGWILRIAMFQPMQAVWMATIHAIATSAGLLSVWPSAKSSSASTSPVPVDSFLKSKSFGSSK